MSGKSDLSTHDSRLTTHASGRLPTPDSRFTVPHRHAHQQEACDSRRRRRRHCARSRLFPDTQGRFGRTRVARQCGYSPGRAAVRGQRAHRRSAGRRGRPRCERDRSWRGWTPDGWCRVCSRPKRASRRRREALRRLRNGTRPEETAQARAALAAAQAEAVNAHSQYERLKGISESSKGRAVSEQDLDAAESGGAHERGAR